MRMWSAQTRSASVATGQGAKLAAAVSLTLAAAKARDHLEDGDTSPMLVPSARHVAHRWSRQGRISGAAIGFDTDLLTDALRADAAAEVNKHQVEMLDAARARVGDPGAEQRRREREAAARAQRAEMEKVVDELMDADDSELGLMKSLRHGDLRDALVDQAALPVERGSRMAGPFSHVIVDEAQELSDAEWQVLLERCPSRSFTVVGDRAQARAGFAEAWAERLDRVGLRGARTASLKFNYRTPSEVMDEAAPVIRAALPDANVPESVRSSGVPVRRGTIAELESVVTTWLANAEEGVACIIAATDVETSFAKEHPRVSVLDPVSAKGLEFDLVVLVRPEKFGDGVSGAVDRYVAMTRATRQLTILSGCEDGEETAGQK